MYDWLPLQSEYLDELIRHEAIVDSEDAGSDPYEYEVELIFGRKTKRVLIGDRSLSLVQWVASIASYRFGDLVAKALEDVYADARAEIDDKAVRPGQISATIAVLLRS